MSWPRSQFTFVKWKKSSLTILPNIPFLSPTEVKNHTGLERYENNNNTFFFLVMNFSFNYAVQKGTKLKLFVHGHKYWHSAARKIIFLYVCSQPRSLSWITIDYFSNSTDLSWVLLSVAPILKCFVRAGWFFKVVLSGRVCSLRPCALHILLQCEGCMLQYWPLTSTTRFRVSCSRMC